MKSIVISSHVTTIDGKQYDGIGNVAIKTLSSMTDQFIFVRNSIDGLLPSEVHYYRKDKIVGSRRLLVPRRPSVLRYIFEVFSTTVYFAFRQKVDVYVGIDPLNALVAILLKKMGRVDRAIFYTADYSISRFNNAALDKVYHIIDMFCVKNADEVWSVSSRIVAIRKEMGLDDEKNVFLPNVPPIEYGFLKKNKPNPYNLITYGILDTQLDFEGTFEAVAILKKEYPKIHFTIIGNGPKEEELKRLMEKMKLSDHVTFLGRQSLEKTLEHASKAGIGLALYTGTWGFNQFGDSTKCREYFNFGLPVISTNTHSTVDEIEEYKAGVVVGKSVDQYVEAIRTILLNYEKYSAGSRKLGDKYEGIHSRLFSDLLGL